MREKSATSSPDSGPGSVGIGAECRDDALRPVDGPSPFPGGFALLDLGDEVDQRREVDGACHAANDDAGAKSPLSTLKVNNALTLSNLNKVLFVFSIVIVMNLLFSVYVESSKVRKASQYIYIQSLGVENKSARRPMPPSWDASKESSPFNETNTNLDGRNIFQPMMPDLAPLAANVPQAPSYRLVGIAESPNPEHTYVMVENTRTQMTFFLQYDVTVENMKLEEIHEDKVIVNIGGESIEIE